MLLAASLLFATMAALVRYPFTSTDGTGGPTVVAPGPQIPDVPMPGADPARTNVQAGPNLTTLPEIKQKADIVGTNRWPWRTTSWSSSTAGSPRTRRQHAYRTMDRSSSSAEHIRPRRLPDGAIYLGFTFDTEGRRGGKDANQLVVLSLADGHEKWRSDGAGVVPANPLVAGDVVYSLGVNSDRISLAIYRTADGTPIWQTDLGPATWCCPTAGLALSGSYLAVSVLYNVGVYDIGNGRLLWTDTTEISGRVGRRSSSETS